MATNASVFNRSMELVVEYLTDKGFNKIAKDLETEYQKKKIENANEPYYPNAADVTKLERIFATNILPECVEQKKDNTEKLSSSARRARSTSARGKTFKPVELRTQEETWEGEFDPGYLFTRVSESELNACEASEYEAMTLPHESYERYQDYELDEATQAIVNEKIESLKQFPEELKKLVKSMGISEEQYDAASEEEVNSLLLDNFKVQFGLPVIPSSVGESDDEEEEIQEEYDSFFLRVVQVRQRTGFQETKDFPIILGELIAGRYQVQEYLGAAAFSTAIQCYDFVTNKTVCLKVIKNNKDFFDQSLDEIKLLTTVKRAAADDLDKYNLLRIYDYFYFKEHLFLVTELLRDNLYEFYQYNIESGDEIYFNIERLKSVSKQILIALEYIHNLGMIHCDLKPENILIKSYSRCLVKVIDLGSSCFIKDHLSSYVQSRSYRAPEVILGLPYGRKIDIWSLGCIIAELFTGQVLFLNDSLATLLARVTAIIGPIPTHMKEQGAYDWRFFTNDGELYDRRPEGAVLITPKPTSLKNRLKSCEDPLFLDFMTRLLKIDPAERPTATEALAHPWLA